MAGVGAERASSAKPACAGSAKLGAAGEARQSQRADGAGRNLCGARMARIVAVPPDGREVATEASSAPVHYPRLDPESHRLTDVRLTRSGRALELALRTAQKDQPQAADLPKIQSKPNPN